MGKSKTPKINCPACQIPAVEATSFEPGLGWRWTDGDTGSCPQCKRRLVVRVSDDYEEDRAATVEALDDLVPECSAPPRLYTHVQKHDERAFTATVKADGSEWTSAAATAHEACARALTSALAVQLQLREAEILPKKPKKARRTK